MSGIARLSLEQAPPIDVPFRLFVTAPLFGMLTAALLLWYGPAALDQRWSPVTLAATHLLTLGYLAMVMCGAMLQMLPVIGGSPVPRVQWIAWGVHPLLTAGVLMLAATFLTGNSTLFLPTATVLGIAFGIFIIAVVAALWRVPIGNVTTKGMGFAVVALAITVGFGISLLLGLGGYLQLRDFQALANTHLTWGLAGWVGLLVSGVAYQVVPMFQLTPEYPQLIRRRFSAGLFLLLVMWSLVYLMAANSRWAMVFTTGLFLMLGLYAWVTLAVQRQRRRKLSDPTLRYWQIGMLLVLLACVLWGVALFTQWELKGGELMMGILAIVGIGISLINGMLLKIFAFLSWFHLQHRQMKLMRIEVSLPSMKKFVEDREAWAQQMLHFAALGLLLAACVESALTRTAGLVFLGSQVMLLYILGRAIRLYRSIDRKFSEPPVIDASTPRGG